MREPPLDLPSGGFAAPRLDALRWQLVTGLSPAEFPRRNTPEFRGLVASPARPSWNRTWEWLVAVEELRRSLSDGSKTVENALWAPLEV